MTPRRRASLPVLLLAVSLTLLSALPASSQELSAVTPAAQSGEGHAAEEGREAGGSGMLSKIINFTILFGGLFLLLRKPIMGLLSQRTKDVSRTLDDAQAARRDAEARMAEARAKVSSLEAELERLRAGAEEEGRREKERIREMAGQEADRLRALAKLEVEAHLKAGVRDLKAYTAELAASLAEERIKARLSASDQAELIDKSIAKLKTLHEESDPR